MLKKKIFLVVLSLFILAFDAGPTNLVVNPWFSDTNCNKDKSGWVDTSVPREWGKSQKDSNPGPCETAIRWHHRSHPEGPGSIHQLITVDNPQEMTIQYWFVSMANGQGSVTVYCVDDGSILHQSTWGGHLKVWDQTPIMHFDSDGCEDLKLEILGGYTEKGGVKITGIELYNLGN